jgi:ribonuclease J
MATGKLQIIPLGGLGEFGMNLMAVRWGDDIIVIGAGPPFRSSQLPGHPRE